MPHSFQGCFAQQCASEGNLHAITAVDIFSQVVEAWVVHKDIVHSIYESMEVSNLQRMKLVSKQLTCIVYGFLACTFSLLVANSLKAGHAKPDVRSMHDSLDTAGIQAHRKVMHAQPVRSFKHMHRGSCCWWHLYCIKRVYDKTTSLQPISRLELLLRP